MKIFIDITILFLVIFSFFFAPQPANANTCGVFEKRIQEDGCEKFSVPTNAHLTYSGNNWECNRGFKLSEDKMSCISVFVPDHATANTIGSFNCNSGFKQSLPSEDGKKVNDKCVKVPDIKDGKFFQFGSDFYCVNGYKKNEQNRTCNKIEIPENAKEDRSSLDGWRCLGGYIRDGDHCKKFTLPEHATWSGDFWKCEAGYIKNYSNNSCDKVKIPENGKAVQTFDGWLCNDGYTKNYHENTCVKNK